MTAIRSMANIKRAWFDERVIPDNDNQAGHVPPRGQCETNKSSSLSLASQVKCMTVREYPSWAVFLSVIGGALILLSGGIDLGFRRSILGDIYRILGTPLVSPNFVSATIEMVGLWGIACGICIIIMGYLLYSQPRSNSNSGIGILVLSMWSFLGSGGFIIGGILAIVGGIMAIIWRPKSPESMEKT